MTIDYNEERDTNVRNLAEIAGTTFMGPCLMPCSIFDIVIPSENDKKIGAVRGIEWDSGRIVYTAHIYYGDEDIISGFVSAESAGCYILLKYWSHKFLEEHGLL